MLLSENTIRSLVNLNMKNQSADISVELSLDPFLNSVYSEDEGILLFNLPTESFVTNCSIIMPFLSLLLLAFWVLGLDTLEILPVFVSEPNFSGHFLGVFDKLPEEPLEETEVLGTLYFGVDKFLMSGLGAS